MKKEKLDVMTYSIRYLSIILFLVGAIGSTMFWSILSYMLDFMNIFVIAMLFFSFGAVMFISMALYEFDNTTEIIKRKRCDKCHK